MLTREITLAGSPKVTFPPATELVPLGATLLANGNFARGTTGWAVEQHAPAVRTYAVTKDFTGGKPSMKITISTAGLDWHVQMNQGGLSLTKGRPYTVSFWARASGATPLSASVSYAGPTNYDSVYQLVSTTLGTTWRQYQISFYAPVRASNLRRAFGGFAATKGNLWFADVKFQRRGGEVYLRTPDKRASAPAMSAIGTM